MIQVENAAASGLSPASSSRITVTDASGSEGVTGKITAAKVTIERMNRNTATAKSVMRMAGRRMSRNTWTVPPHITVVASSRASGDGSHAGHHRDLALSMVLVE